MAAKPKSAKKKSNVVQPKRTGRKADPVADARAAAFTDQRPEKAFGHFRKDAEAVLAEGLPFFSGQALLMRTNAVAALKALEPHLPAVAARLADAKVQEVLELPSLIMGLDFAVNRVPTAKLSAKEIDTMLHDGAPWRALALSYLEVASNPLINLLPAERVRAVREGTGKIDKAQDFVSIAGLFAEFAPALAAKHPFDASQLDRLATLGGALVQQLTPGNALTPVAKRGSESLLRDQFASLVADRYDHLQVLAAVALGKRKADDLLPALRSSVAASPASVAEPVADPAAPAVS